MPVIRPLEDLETKPREIIEAAHASKEPVFLTDKGYGDLVVVSMEMWEEKSYDKFVFQKLKDSESNPNTQWLSHEDVFNTIKEDIDRYEDALKDA